MLNTDAIPIIVFAMTFRLPLCKLFRKGDGGFFVKTSFIKLLAKFWFGFTWTGVVMLKTVMPNESSIMLTNKYSRYESD